MKIVLEQFSFYLHFDIPIYVELQSNAILLTVIHRQGIIQQMQAINNTEIIIILSRYNQIFEYISK